MNRFFQHRVIILNKGSMPRKRTGRITTSQHDVTRDSLTNGPSWGGGWGELREKYVFCVPRKWNCSVSYLSFVYGMSLWAKLNGGENSLRWRANMIPLLSIMTLCFQAIHISSVQKSNPLPLQIFIGWKFEDYSHFGTLIIYMASCYFAFIHHFQIEIFKKKCKNTREINSNFNCLSGD